MGRRLRGTSLALMLLVALAAEPAPAALRLDRLGGFDSGLGEGAAEIVALDAVSRRVFVVNARAASVDVVDLANPAAFAACP